jgi:dUTP pyrophosphatase
MKFAKVRDVKSPVRGTGKAAGIDFFVPNFGGNKGLIVNPGADVLIPSGIKMEIPEGYMLMAADKSGVVTSKWACIGAGRTPKAEAFESIVILGAKIVDEDYQGEIFIHLINVGRAKVYVKPGMKMAQFILVPVSYEMLEEVPEAELFSRLSARGDGTLGSTGSY